jgi:hypothetical protein
MMVEEILVKRMRNVVKYRIQPYAKGAEGGHPTTALCRINLFVKYLVHLHLCPFATITATTTKYYQHTTTITSPYLALAPPPLSLHSSRRSAHNPPANFRRSRQRRHRGRDHGIARPQTQAPPISACTISSGSPGSCNERCLQTHRLCFCVACYVNDTTAKIPLCETKTKVQNRNALAAHRQRTALLSYYAAVQCLPPPAPGFPSRVTLFLDPQYLRLPRGFTVKHEGTFRRYQVKASLFFECRVAALPFTTFTAFSRLHRFGGFPFTKICKLPKASSEKKGPTWHLRCCCVLGCGKVLRI